MSSIVVNIKQQLTLLKKKLKPTRNEKTSKRLNIKHCTKSI
jgi:hypothetical protein